MPQSAAPEKPYGQIFTPSTVSLPVKNTHTLFHGSSKVAFVRLTWVDLTNVTRCRVIPIDAFRKLLEAHRPGIGVITAVLGLVGVTCAPGFNGTGEYLYCPDMPTWRHCGYAPGHVSVLGWFEDKKQNNVDVTEAGDSLRGVPLCPRTQLRNTIRDASSLGISFLVGIETEFILLKANEPDILSAAVNNQPWSTTAALLTGTPEANCMEEIASALHKADVELLMYHAEAAPGQYEVVTAPLSPLEAADALVVTRETIRNIACKHGLRATFAPRLFADSCGSSAHAHISIHRSPDNTGTVTLHPNPDTNNETTMNTLERSFLQTLLTYLPELVSITMPISASYARVQDGIWSGGTYVSWGTDNREALVRLTGPSGAHHFEVRAHDGTANPHLALTALIGAGLLGVKSGVELVVKECTGPAAELSEEERQARGITGRMPRSLAEAREKTRTSAAVKEVFGNVFVEKYLAVNEKLEEFMRGNSPEEEIRKLVSIY